MISIDFRYRLLTINYVGNVKGAFDWYIISMCNQMVTSEIRNNFTRVLSKSLAFRRGKLLGFGQNASEIIS